MSRSTQFIGLNERAKLMLEEQQAESALSVEGCKGLCGEPVIINVYKTKDNAYYEIIQYELWSSGPMIFTCLVDTYGNKIFEWTFEEMITY